MSIEKNLNNFIEELIQEIEQELEEATATGNIAGYNVPGAFSNGGSKDKKRKKKLSTQFGMKIVGKIDEDEISEGLVSPKRGHEFFQLTKDTPIKYITRSYTTLNAPGVLWKHDTDYIDGKKGAYLIDYFGAAFYVDLKKKFASKIYPIKDQDKLSWKSNFIDVDKAPQMSDWKKYLKEDINESKQKRPVNRWLELKNDESMHPHKKMAMGLKELKYQLAETEKFFNWYNKIKTMNELDSTNYWKRTQSHIYKIKERLINIAKTLQEIEK